MALLLNVKSPRTVNVPEPVVMLAVAALLVPLTASVGYAILQDGEAPDDLVRRADTALYAAKAAGRNTVRGPATLPRRT